MKGRHTSLDKSLKATISWLETIPGVKKIVLGISESCRHKYSPGFIKVLRDVEGGFLINGYSGKGVTKIFIGVNPIDQREAIQTLIKARFSS